MHIRIWNIVKCQVNTLYSAPKLLKSPNALNLLDVLLDAISCMNGKKMIMLSIDGKEKQKAEMGKKIKVLPNNFIM